MVLVTDAVEKTVTVTVVPVTVVKAVPSVVLIVSVVTMLNVSCVGAVRVCVVVTVIVCIGKFDEHHVWAGGSPRMLEDQEAWLPVQYLGGRLMLWG